MADQQDDDTPSAGGQSDSETEQKPKTKISTPRQKAAAARVKEEPEDGESPVKKVRTSCFQVYSI
jgi:hypothetical protein